MMHREQTRSGTEGDGSIRDRVGPSSGQARSGWGCARGRERDRMINQGQSGARSIRTLL